jgi:hypothetical protein
MNERVSLKEKEVPEIYVSMAKGNPRILVTFILILASIPIYTQDNVSFHSHSENSISILCL